MRLRFIDGLRGLTALYVVVHHAVLEWDAGALGPVAGAVRALFGPYGHYAVDVFIVVSGFSLMLPVVRGGDGRLRGGLGGYFWRRARRILPAYYAVLGVCLLVVALVPGMGQIRHARWDAALPALEARTIALHLLLVHNLGATQATRIDPPAWSIATEWQIYFLMPALLAIWRRWGMAATVLAGLGLGNLIALSYLVTGDAAALVACPWYIGLFAFGMAAAAARPGRFPWGALALGLAAVAVLGKSWDWRVGRLELVPEAVLDPIVGAAAAGLILHCLSGSSARRGAARVLEARWAVALGSFSYSLYLVHFPALALLTLALREWRVGPDAGLALSVLAGVPLCLGASYLFFLIFERPFLARPAGSAPPRPAYPGRFGTRPDLAEA